YEFLNRSSSFQTVRNIDGHGCLMTSIPPFPGSTEFPSSSKTSAIIPGVGLVAEPGLVVVIPGNGAIRTLPFSVCHHVSTIGHCSFPTYLWNHIHASGLIGSPTVPSKRKLLRSCFARC